MITGPLVSIITIVFNGEKHLQQTINSVSRQTYGKIEYIIVDGGSTDGTVKIIRKNASVVTKWISENDSGISDAFNKGIDMCSGEIIGLVNSDDWLETRAVEVAVKSISDADLVYGEVQFWFNEKLATVTKSDHLKLRMGMTIAHPACFVRKDLYRRFGKFNLKYKVAMDYDLMMRFLHHGASFQKVNMILTNMRTEGVSDYRWLLGIREELIIKNQYYHPMANWYYFLRQYFIFTAKRILRRINS